MSADVRGRIDAALRDFMTTATDELRAIGEELAPAADALQDYVVEGGKRLRPTFCYWGAIAAGAPDSEGLIRAAASLELLQACALVHDDLIDHSDTRRGQPSMHRRFAGVHRDAGWSGDPDDFGGAAAILLGDVLLAWSDAMFASSALDDAALRRAQPVSTAMRTEVMAGQYLDIVEQARGETTVERALRVARFKSAKYTVERPLQLGAAIAGASEKVVAAYSAYGIQVGEAFQLADDLAGVFGDPAVTGKPVGDDLREGKQTVLIALALEKAAPADASLLRTKLGDPSLPDSDIEMLREVISSSGAQREVQAMVAARWEAALAALVAHSIDTTELVREGYDALVALAGAVTRPQT